MAITTTITVTGPRAAAIERANNASVYGIYCNARACTDGRIAANNEVYEHLRETVGAWSWFDILSTKTIDTTGTRVPYMAEIKYIYE